MSAPGTGREMATGVYGYFTIGGQEVKPGGCITRAAVVHTTSIHQKEGGGSMGWIGPKGEDIPPHPRQEPRFEGAA